MGLAVKLTYKQLKNNKRRAFWTLLGIILSTSVLNTIAGFAVSAIYAYYSRFGEINQRTLAFIAGISLSMGMLVVITSVIVISGAFKISADQRVRELCILKSAGADKNQILTVLVYEGVILWCIAAPIGLMIGLLLQFFGTGFANILLAPMNEFLFAPIEFVFYISPPIILVVLAITFAAVIVSGLIPAKKAAGISVAEGLKQVPDKYDRVMRIRFPGIINRIFGYEGILAAKTLRYNSKLFRAVTSSLSIGVVLVFVAESFSVHLAKAAGTNREGINANIEVYYYSMPADGNTETIDLQTAAAVTERLRAYGGVTLIGVGFYTGFRANENYSGTLVVLDDETYADIAESAGVPAGSNILINTLRTLDNQGYLTVTHPHDLVGKTVNFARDDTGFDMDFEIHGEIFEGPAEIVNMVNYSANDLTVIVPEGDSDYYAWFSLTNDNENYMAYAMNAMQELITIRSPDNVYLQTADLTAMTAALG